MNVQLVTHGQTYAQLSAITLQPSLVEEIRVNLEVDSELQRIRQNLDKRKSPGFLIYDDGSLLFQNRLCVPNSVDK